MANARKTHRFLVTLEEGGDLNTHSGILFHKSIVEAGPGGVCYSNRRKPFLVSRPTLEEYVLELPRSATPTYPKDAAATLMLLGLRPGDAVLEAGSGSAGLTGHLAHAVGRDGRVWSLDVMPDRHNLCRKNLAKSLGGEDAFAHVHFQVADVASPDGLPSEIGAVDAVALDVMEPWDAQALDNLSAVLRPGGKMVVTCPNTTQVQALVNEVSTRSELYFCRMMEVTHREWTVRPPFTLHPATHQGPLFTAFLVQFMRTGRTIGTA